MSELERELRNVGAEIEYPPTPDLAGAVRERIEARRRSRFSLSRRKLALAFAVLAAGLGAAMATPQARTAILEWLGLRGVAIERVATEPSAPLGADLDLGERVSLAEAGRHAGFSPLVPRGGLGDPDEVYVRTSAAGEQVAFVYRTGDGERLLVTQFRASLRAEFIEKSAGPGTTIERVAVNGEPGFWLAGAPHTVVYVNEAGEPVPDTLRLAANTLL